MPYTVQLIGLTYFQPLERGCRALMPDGRFPENRSISSHIPSISVRNKDLLDYEGWRDDQVGSDAFETEFVFPPSFIKLPFTQDPAATYSDVNLIPRLPSLSSIDKNFRIDHATANWIGSIDIGQGTLQALRVPGIPNGPLIVDWQVDFDDRIEITVTSRKGWPRRRILLEAGSEVAIVNTSRGLAPRSDALDHFRVYEELSAEPVQLSAPALNTSAFAESKSNHPSYRAARPATFIDTSCSPVTG
jgi:hypothetical protein